MQLKFNELRFNSKREQAAVSFVFFWWQSSPMVASWLRYVIIKSAPEPSGRDMSFIGNFQLQGVAYVCRAHPPIYVDFHYDLQVRIDGDVDTSAEMRIRLTRYLFHGAYVKEQIRGENFNLAVVSPLFEYYVNRGVKPFRKEDLAKLDLANLTFWPNTQLYVDDLEDMMASGRTFSETHISSREVPEWFMRARGWLSDGL